MRIVQHLKTLLLITLLALTASGVVNAKVASGLQHLGAGWHQDEAVFNLLMHQGKTTSSTTSTSGSSVVPKGAGSAINNSNKVKLNKQHASQEQLGELNSGVAERIAGAGTNKQLRDVPRLANEYGGSAGDWAKVRSSNRSHMDGFNQETNAYQNVRTGQVVKHTNQNIGALV